MNKYLPILCITASLAFLPACTKKSRDQKVEECKKDLKDCGKTIKQAGKDVKRQGKELKDSAKELCEDASEACEHTKWCGCEKK